ELASWYSLVHVRLPLGQQVRSIVCHGLRKLTKDLPARHFAPHHLEHLRLALQDFDPKLPLSFPLDVEVRRVMVVRPEPARQARYLEARDLGHGLPITATRILGYRTFFNGTKTASVRSGGS